MSIHEAIFRAGAEVYQADNCDPVVRAMDAGRIEVHAVARGHYPGRRLAKRALPGVCTLGYWDISTPQDWGLDWHRNEGVELTFLERGELGFAVDGRSCDLHADDLTITRPWQLHRVGRPHIGPGRLHWLILDVGVRRPNQAWKWPEWVILSPADIRRLTTILRHNEQPVWRATPEIRRCWQRLAEAVRADEQGSRLSHLATFANELLLLVLEMLDGRGVTLDRTLSSSERTVQMFVRELREDLSQAAHPWSVKEMAKVCGLGVTRFTALCQQVTNMSPTRYLAHCRVQWGMQLLRERDASVTQVAMRCGFGSSQYFATVLRQHTGKRPSDFRGGDAIE